MKTLTFKLLYALLCASLLFALTGVQPAYAASTVVNDASDALHSPGCATTGTGTCSLRDAITYANANAGADTITFSVTGTIDVTSNLPDITESLTIKGPGASSLIIDGVAVGDTFRALNSASQFTLQDLSVTNTGTVIRASSTTTLVRVHFYGNGNGGSSAAVIQAIGPLNLIDSAIVNNGPDKRGISTSETTLIVNSTIANNTGTNSGGGIHVFGGTTTIINSTIANNIANAGAPFPGGGIRASGNVILINTIVSGNVHTNNSSTNNCGVSGGSITSLGNNLASDNTCDSYFTNPGDLTSADPLLGAVTDNGGDVPTMRLNPGSPAINAGDNALLPADTFDLDNDGNTTETLPVDGRGAGFPRIDSGTVDIGAYELDLLPLMLSHTRQTPSSSPTNADTLVFRATFSEDVTGVDTTDFAVNSTTTATITNVTPVTASTYDVTISGGDLAGFNGTVNLNLNAAQNITDLALNAMPTTEPATDQTYTVVNGSVTFNSNGGTGTMAPQFASVAAPLTSNTFVRTGYLFTGWNTAANGSGIAYANGASYPFMANVTLYAQWAVDVVLTPIFTDVPFTHWANGYIERLYKYGVTSGCGTSPMIYCPEGKATRAEMAIFILRGKYNTPFVSYTPPAVETSTGFADVPVGSFADAWIKQLAAEGITIGCGDGNYCPNANITRAEMAIFLLRGKYGSAYNPPAATGIVFSDVSVTSFAAAWIEQLAKEGITSGCGAGKFCPGNPVTRAEMAVFLVRAFGLP